MNFIELYFKYPEKPEPFVPKRQWLDAPTASGQLKSSVTRPAVADLVKGALTRPASKKLFGASRETASRLAPDTAAPDPL